MKRKIYYLPCVIAFVILSACQDLDREVLTGIYKENVIHSYQYLGQMATAVYLDLPEGFLPVDGAMMASVTDEAEHTLETSNVQKFNTGAWNALDNPDDVWAKYYKGIRKANFFLQNVDSMNLDVYKLDPNPSQQLIYKQRIIEKNRWKYEVRFLRAFYYFELVKRYGGVPLITDPLSLTDNYQDIKRNSLADCIKFITSECDSAASKLPLPAGYAATDLGRITKGAALSLKSRALLYAASDLYNTPSWATGYTEPELISLTGDRMEKWKAAADAAKAVIDLNTYTLATNYATIFSSTSFSNSEAILVRRNTGSNSFEKANFPIGFDLGQSGTTPSQNLVDAYEVKVDATTSMSFDWSNPSHANAPYSNRDPRLGMSIITNGSGFKGGKTVARPVECFTGGLDGKGIVQATKTGYYLKKYVDETLDLLQNKTSTHSWILIRLSEIFLNYAEALNEYNPGNPDIKIYIDKVRARTGVNMPPLASNLSQAAMRSKIRNERRVELAFEDHRFWDVRRWMIAPEVLGTPIKGLEINRLDVKPTYTYAQITVENRVFEPKMYFYPIPQSELLKTKGWVQNPLW